MMESYEIQFSPAGLDMRPPGAVELLEHLAKYAKMEFNPDSLVFEALDPRDAGDAHNYICALETRVVQLNKRVEGLLRAIQSMNKVLPEHNVPLPTLGIQPESN